MLQGDWEEGRKESARETMGRGKKIREAIALSLFPSSNARSLFSKIYDLLEYPVRASGGESEHAKNPSLKRCTFCSVKISSQPREGFMELMNCGVESDVINSSFLALVFALCCVI